MDRRSRNHRRLAGGLVATLALIVAACTSGSTPTVAPSAPPTAAPSASAAESASPSPEAFPSPELTTVRIGISNLEANGFISKFAADLGLYKKYGIDNAEVLYFEGAQRNTAALIANQIEVGSDSPETTLLSLTTEDPLLDVAVYANGFLDCIVAGPDLKSAADLKGKRFAISSPGGQSHAEVVVALEALKLPIEEVTIVQIGGQGARVAALEAGSVDVIPVDCALADELVQSGKNLILELPTVGIDFATSNLRLKRSFVEQNPNTTLAVVAANLEAMQVMFSDEAKAVTSLTAWAQVAEADAKASIQGFKVIAQRNLMPTLEGYESIKKVQILTNPDIANVNVSEAFTTSILDKLRDLGLNEELGVPAS
jgi:NitT/TauT family transport system substrate-binding protein